MEGQDSGSIYKREQSTSVMPGTGVGGLFTGAHGKHGAQDKWEDALLSFEIPITSTNIVTSLLRQARTRDDKIHPKPTHVGIIQAKLAARCPGRQRRN